MVNFSENELLEKMDKFPKHELTAEQKGKIVQKLSAETFMNNRHKVRTFHRMGAFVALLCILVISPVLFLFSNDKNQGHIVDNDKAPIAYTGKNFTLSDDVGGKTYSQQLLGIPDSVGLLAPEKFIEKDYRSVAKIMIHLWGNETELVNKTLMIRGEHVKTGEKIEVAHTALGSGLYGADANAVTRFRAFPKPGEWDLEFFIDNKLFNEFSIHVQEAIPIGNSTLIIPKEDLRVGSYSDIQLELNEGELPDRVKLTLTNTKDDTETYEFVYSEKQTHYVNKKGKSIAHYTGNLSIPKRGKWKITVQGQSKIINIAK